MTLRSPTALTDAARRLGIAVLACALVVLGGCATGPNPRDPFEPFNRKMMEFNEGVDAVALKPAATAYREMVPPVIRTGVSNFFSNLGDAWSSVNSLLQLKIGDAAENMMRFSFNTVFGLGGILDLASEMHIERHREDFGQTLGRWGVPTGPYIVLPLVGPSTLRDSLALPIDTKGNPVHYAHHATTRNSLYALRAVDIRSNLLRASSVLDEAALDKYTFTRDAHLQRRRAQIFDDKTDRGGQEPQLEAPGAGPDDAGKIPPLPPEDTASPPAAPAAR
jgi:phospholipid-binding lipoprotein MlaA